MRSQSWSIYQFWPAARVKTILVKIAKFVAEGRPIFSRTTQKRGKLRFWNFCFIFYMHKAKKLQFFNFAKIEKNDKRYEFTLKTPQTLVQFVVLMGNFPFGQVP